MFHHNNPNPTPNGWLVVVYNPYNNTKVSAQV